MTAVLGRQTFPFRKPQSTRYRTGLNSGLTTGEVVQDYFDDRILAAGTSLGSARIGGTWTPYNTVTGTTARVDNGQGIITPNVAPKSMVHSLGSSSVQRVWVRALVSWDSEAVGGSQEISLQARGSQLFTGPDDDCYRADLNDDPTLGLRLFCTRMVSGGANSLGSGVTIDAGGYVAGDLYWLELSCDGNLIQAKAYKYGAADPGWLSSFTDGTWTVAGEVGLRVRANSGNTNLSTARYYEYHAYDLSVLIGGTIYTDSGTVSVLITPSYTDNREITENTVTVPVLVSPSGTDLHEITDAATVSVKLTPSSTDSLQAADAATVAVKVSPSSSDVAGFVDAATVAVKITPSAAEIADQGDSLTIPVLVTPSSTDAAAYVDSQTVGVVVTPSAVEIRERTDSGTVAVLVTPATVSELREQTDAVTVGVKITPTGTDQSQFGDSATVSVKLTPSSTDAAGFVDTGTVGVTITPTTVVEQMAKTDQATIPVTVTPSGTDLHTISDANTVNVAVTPVAQEALAGADAGVVPVVITPSATDLVAKTWIDAATVPVTILPATDAESRESLDSGTVRVSVTPAAPAEAVNLYVVPVTLTPEGTDARLFEEFQLLVVTVTPDGTESELSLSTITEVPVITTPSMVEIFDISEAATVDVLISPATVVESWTPTDYLLVGTLTQKWGGTLEDRVIIATPEVTEFTAVIEERIYSGRFRGRGDE